MSAKLEELYTSLAKLSIVVFDIYTSESFYFFLQLPEIVPTHHLFPEGRYLPQYFCKFRHAVERRLCSYSLKNFLDYKENQKLHLPYTLLKAIY